MKFKTKLLALSVLLALLAIGSVAQAEIIYQVNAPEEGSFTAAPGAWWGNGFKTAQDSWTLNSVTLGRLRASHPGGNFFISLYSSVENKPKSALMTFSGEASPDVVNSYEYIPTSPYTLSANTTYWIVAGVNGGEGAYSLAEYATTSTGTFTGRCYSINQGTSFSASILDSPLIMTIDATKGGSAVPEASTLVGFGSALAMAGPGIVGYLRRRRA